jgi:hypothetical protein
MKGAIGFLVGIIGLCFFISVTLLILIILDRRSESIAMVLTLLVVDFVFLNVLVASFFRMLGHLHETMVYPDDPYYQPLRGRVLYFVGYIGLLVTLVLFFMVGFLSDVLRMRMGPRDRDAAIVLALIAGLVFLGCLLGGVLRMLSDIFHKAFYRTMVGMAGEREDELDISHRGARQLSPRDADEERLRRWED